MAIIIEGYSDVRPRRLRVHVSHREIHPRQREIHPRQREIHPRQRERERRGKAELTERSAATLRCRQTRKQTDEAVCRIRALPAPSSLRTCIPGTPPNMKKIKIGHAVPLPGPGARTIGILTLFYSTSSCRSGVDPCDSRRVVASPIPIRYPHGITTHDFVLDGQRRVGIRLRQSGRHKPPTDPA